MDRERFKNLCKNAKDCVMTYRQNIDQFLSDGSKFKLDHLVGNAIEMLRKEFLVNIDQRQLLDKFGNKVDGIGKSQSGEMTDIVMIDHEKKVVIVETCKFTHKAKTTQGTDIFTVRDKAQSLKDTKFPDYKFYAVVTTKAGVSPNFFDHMEQQATKLFHPRDIIVIELDDVKDNTTNKPFVVEDIRNTWNIMYEYYSTEQNKLLNTIQDSDQGQHIDYWSHQAKAIAKYTFLKKKGQVRLALIHKWRAGKTETAIGIMKEMLEQ
jgi:hypothetical protein